MMRRIWKKSGTVQIIVKIEETIMIEVKQNKNITIVLNANYVNIFDFVYDNPKNCIFEINENIGLKVKLGLLFKK